MRYFLHLGVSVIINNRNNPTWIYWYRVNFTMKFRSPAIIIVSDSDHV